MKWSKERKKARKDRGRRETKIFELKKAREEREYKLQQTQM